VRPEVDQRLSELMRKALAGDEAAYGTFLREIAGVVRAVARRRLNSGGGIDPEDIVQETLLAIHLKRHTWRASEKIGPWVYAITRYKIVDAYRRRGQQVTIDIDTIIDTLESEPPKDAPSEREITLALEGLTGGQKQVVKSISVDGRSIRETAQNLGMKETAVRVALHRGLNAIAARFGKRT